jgi:DNA-binding transcriptional regulator YhcF (GntR family)
MVTQISGQEAGPSVRIAGELARRITTGAIRPGETVPSTRQITREFGVAMATATRVLAALRQQGLVHVVPGVGTVVGAASAKDEAAPVSNSVRTPPSAAAVPLVVESGSEQLTREGIVQAAVTIADTEGIAALSMRRVAAGLGTATMSLYRHVRNKDQLLALMADRVFMQYPLPAADPGWRASLAALCRLQWRVYQHHPWVAQYVSMTRPQLIPRAMAHTERAMIVLKGIGLDINDRLHAAVTLANYVRGTAVNLEPEAQAEQDTGLSSDEWMQTQSGQMERIVASGQFPAFAEMSTTAEIEFSLDTLFEFGLQRLLDGLEVLVQRRRAQRTATGRP